MDDHISAEIVAGTITSKQDALDYLTWTYFYRRLQQNPTYYGLEDASQGGVDAFLSQTINNVVSRLEQSGCVDVIDDFELEPTISSRIASYYYLRHQTLRHMRQTVKADSLFEDLLSVLSNVPEYSELPVRCNEDLLNREIEKDVVYPVQTMESYISPHVKAYVLLQAHFARLPLPISDYITDQITVLDSAIRFCQVRTDRHILLKDNTLITSPYLQAMIDVAADSGLLTTSLTIMNMLQCIKQARYLHDSTLLTLPGVDESMLDKIKYKGNPIKSLAELTQYSPTEIQKIFQNISRLSKDQIKAVSIFAMP